MRSDVRRDMNWSDRLFQDVVWPKIKNLCGDGKSVFPSQNDELHRKLDMYAGIDLWHTQESEGRMRGIASRVQRTETSYDTFTIRKTRPSGQATELEKRIAAINSQRGWVYPHLTIQAYVNDRDVLLAAAVIQTIDLYRYVVDFPDELEENRPQNGRGETFAIARWGWIMAREIKILRYQVGDEDQVKMFPLDVVSFDPENPQWSDPYIAAQP